MHANQLRLYFSSFAYVLMQTLRRLALQGTALARAQCDTIRLKLLKVGVQVRISVRKVWLAFAESYSVCGIVPAGPDPGSRRFHYAVSAAGLPGVSRTVTGADLGRVAPGKLEKPHRRAETRGGQTDVTRRVNAKTGACT